MIQVVEYKNSGQKINKSMVLYSYYLHKYIFYVNIKLMYIVLERYFEQCDKENVINIIQTSDDLSVEKWIEEYILNKIKSLKYSPLQKDIKDIDYIIKHSNNSFVVSQILTKVLSGYLYNTTNKTTVELFDIRYISYNGENVLFNSNKNELCLKLNSEINNRILRQLDKDSLYQIFVNLQQRISFTKNWNNESYSEMISEVVGNFKKELYSNVVKKLQRFGTNSKQVLPPIKSNTGCCSLQAKKNQ